MVNDSERLVILVAEDDPTNSLFLVRLLQHLGYDAVTARDGHDVLKILNEQHIDAVLMDIQMPLMDGLEATRRIRQGGGAWAPEMPVIVTTAYMLGAKDTFDLDTLVDAQVPKPVEPDLLGSVLASLLSAGGRRPPAQKAVVDVAGQAVDAGAESDILDRAKTLERLKGEEEFINQIYEVFIASLDERCETLGNALASGDAENLIKAGHSLKGAASTINAERLHKAALAVEMAARQGDLQECARLLEVLWLDLAELRAKLEQYLFE